MVEPRGFPEGELGLAFSRVGTIFQEGATRCGERLPRLTRTRASRAAPRPPASCSPTPTVAPEVRGV